MRPLLKKWLQRDGFINVLTWFASLYMRFVYKTTRWSMVGGQYPQKEIQEGRGFITSFWHQRLLMAVFGWVYPPVFSMIISAHKDGQLIAKTVARFGIQWIPGSSSKGGAQALRIAVRSLKGGQVVGITPDGPRGPRHEVQGGAIVMAQLAKVNILPFTYAMSRFIQLKTWDQFIFPLPFGRGVIAWGAPVDVKNLSIEEGQQLLESKMMMLQTEAGCALEKA